MIIQCKTVSPLALGAIDETTWTIDNALSVWCGAWRGWLPESISYLTALLQPDERQKSLQFRFADDQARYALTRAWLRHLLGKYLRTAPKHLPLIRNHRNKPSLALPNAIQFSVSHSGEWIAISLAPPHILLGIDIEPMQPAALVNWQSISQAYFCAAEQQYLSQQSTHQTPTEFVRLWTRKEALLKAVGAGLNEDIAHLPTVDGMYIIDNELLSEHFGQIEALYVYTWQYAGYWFSLASNYDLPFRFYIADTIICS